MIGCKKDDKTSVEDLSLKVVGNYMGTYLETTDGASVSAEDVQTIVTKLSESEIKVNIQVVPGLAAVVFNATMTDGTKFDVPKFTLFDGELEGTGSLNGANLNIDLLKEGTTTDKVVYNGIKQ